ncbi:MAG TPA: sulfatase [Armatimonadetes bacterium]|nr:sulfatase [Armatimonadota bacterium]
MRILLLDLDTLRPDHLGCYGYHRATSPTIDAIAERGVRFTNYYCSDAPCLPSRAALVSGQHGLRSGLVGHGGTAAEFRLEGTSRGFRSDFSRRSLWQFIRDQGYHTASISPFAERHSAWWFNAGFTTTHDTGAGGLESAEHVTPHVLDWLDGHAESDNWLLHLNYWDPHTPYRAPAEFGNPFADEPLPGWMTPELLAEHRTQPGLHGCWEINMYDDGTNPAYPRHPGSVPDMDGWRTLIDGYDCGIRYLDDHLARIMNHLADAGVLDETAIVVTSDHGENMGELNCYAEHGSSDYVTHRIPMILSWPGGVQGRVDEQLHYNLDLGPTLADLWDVAPRRGWQGESFAGALRGEAYAARDHVVLGQMCHGATRSVRFGPWQYIRVYHDFYHLWPAEMLFNIEDDPHELNDLAAARPEICAQGARLMMDWVDGQLAQMDGAPDPLWTVLAEGGPEHSRGALPAYLKRLEATGRGQHVEELRRRHPGEFA